MQAIATLVQNDPYLKLSACERIEARRDRRDRFAYRRRLVILPPVAAPTPVYQMWFDDLIEAARIALGPQRAPKVEEIQAVCALHYGVSRADILSPGRTADVMRPRQVAMYLSRLLTNKSFPEIGRRTGGRDHTTVVHAARKMAHLIARNKELAAEVDAIKSEINARIT